MRKSTGKSPAKTGVSRRGCAECTSALQGCCRRRRAEEKNQREMERKLTTLLLSANRSSSLASAGSSPCQSWFREPSPPSLCEFVQHSFFFVIQQFPCFRGVDLNPFQKGLISISVFDTCYKVEHDERKVSARTFVCIFFFCRRLSFFDPTLRQSAAPHPRWKRYK